MELVETESRDSVSSTPDIENIERKKELRRLERLEQKRLSEESILNARKEKAMKSMNYLLGLSEKYTSFVQTKILNSQVKKSSLKERNKLQPTLADLQTASNITEIKTQPRKYADLLKYLKYFVGDLRQYQIDGVTWMTVLFENGLNGILADEMGLGKTIQIIALICHLLQRNTEGPYLIVAPLSTIPNWQSEFKKFAPKVPVVVFHGSQDSRRQLYKEIRRKYILDDQKIAPVVIVAFGTILSEKNFLGQFTWQYIIIDEAHRIKNHESKLSLELRDFQSLNRLLLTGTPLQNNITELWALLNFILPHIFKNMDTFAALFVLEDIQDNNKLLKQEQSTNMVSKIHKVLAPFMLRRLKSEVLPNNVPKKEVFIYCPLSKLQRDLYSYILEKNLAKLRGQDDEAPALLQVDMPRPKRKCRANRKCEIETEDDDFSDVEESMLEELKKTGEKIEKKTAAFVYRIHMQNTTMMFKQVVDHPYLIHFPLDPNSDKKELLVDEEIINSSGKMQVLDLMLTKLKRKGHKVLLFSTLVMVLDIIEDYMLYRGHNYRRLDGSRSLEQRADSIRDFNEDPDVLVFLISTRAGGLGLNLTAADTVIFFDRDWNPQADIQAQDRCHRIGQTKPVAIYTLVAKSTIDEKIIQRGNVKRRLEKIVIQDGKFKTLNQEDRSKTENALIELQQLLNREDSTSGFTFSEHELDEWLDRSDLYKQMEEQNTKENE